MGLFDLLGKKMSPQEAFDLLLEGTAKKSVLKEAVKITKMSDVEYMAPSISLALFLGVYDKDTEIYPTSFNSIMMSVVIGLEENNEKCISNAEKVIRKNQLFAEDLIEYAKSSEKNAYTIYLAYAYLHGWGVERDRKIAMDYAISAKEHASESDKSLIAIDKVIKELND